MSYVCELNLEKHPWLDVKLRPILQCLPDNLNWYVHELSTLKNHGTTPRAAMSMLLYDNESRIPLKVDVDDLKSLDDNAAQILDCVIAGYKEFSSAPEKQNVQELINDSEVVIEVDDSTFCYVYGKSFATLFGLTKAFPGSMISPLSERKDLFP